MILVGISRTHYCANSKSRGHHRHCAVFIHSEKLHILVIHVIQALILALERTKMQERIKLLSLCSNLGVCLVSKREIQQEEGQMALALIHLEEQMLGFLL